MQDLPVVVWPTIRVDWWFLLGVSRCLVGSGLRRRELFSSTMLLLTIVLLTFTSMVAESKELERFSRKGKVVSQEENGNIAIELRRKRWEDAVPKN